MQKIWIFHSSDELYGSDRVLLEIVKGLDKASWQVTVILPNDLPYQAGLSQKLLAEGIAVENRALAVLRRRYQNPPGLLKLGWFLMCSLPMLAWQMRRQKVKLVYTNTGVVLSGAMAARIASVPHIWGLKEFLPNGKIKPILARLYSWFSCCITVTSAAVSHDLSAAFPPAAIKVKIIPNSVDTHHFQPDGLAREKIRAELKISATTLLCGMVGRIAQTKGPEILIEAAKILQVKYPQACFLLVGGAVPGEANYLQSLRQKVPENVRFLDFQPDIAPLLNALDILVIPSLRPEGFGLTAIEAMAVGLPVVAAGHGGPLETIEPDVTGLLYNPPDDAYKLAGCLEELFNDEALRQRLGQRGREKAVCNFSRESEIAAFRFLFESQ